MSAAAPSERRAPPVRRTIDEVLQFSPRAHCETYSDPGKERLARRCGRRRHQTGGSTGGSWRAARRLGHRTQRLGVALRSRKRYSPTDRRLRPGGQHSCERRKSRAAARRRSERRRSSSASDDDGGGFKARCASSSQSRDLSGGLHLESRRRVVAGSRDPPSDRRDRRVRRLARTALSRPQATVQRGGSDSAYSSHSVTKRTLAWIWTAS